MKRFIIFIVVCVVLFSSCSSPESRYEAASEEGEVVFQKEKSSRGVADYFIVRKPNGDFYLVEVNGDGYVSSVYYTNIRSTATVYPTKKPQTPEEGQPENENNTYQRTYQEDDVYSRTK